MALPQDWKEFIELLNFHRVDYVVGGAIAVSTRTAPICEYWEHFSRPNRNRGTRCGCQRHAGF